MRINRSRIWLIAGVIAFIGVFNCVYVLWLFPHYGYMGFRYEEPPMQYLALAWLLTAFPSIFMPVELSRPSQFIYWVLYLIVFIPSIFIPLFVRFSGLSDILGLMLSLFVGFMLLGVGYMLPLLRFHAPSVSPTVFWSSLTGFTLVLIFAVANRFRGALSIVSFSEVYEGKRLAGGELLSGGLVGYAASWLGNILFPLFIATGFITRRFAVVALGMAGQVFLYATAGQKGFLIANGIMIVHYIILFRKGAAFGVKYVWGFTIALIGLLVVANAIPVEVGGVFFLVLATVFMRIVGIPGQLTAEYHDFFLNNVHTHFTHVNAIGWFFQYPYDKALGYEVGYYMSTNVDLDANANFWAMDGLASFGLVGVLMVSLMGAALFWLIDSACRKHDARFVSLSLTVVALSLCNGSLFTAILTGGIVLAVIIWNVMPELAVETSGRWH